MDTLNNQSAPADDTPSESTAPLSPVDARHAEAEARQHAASTGAELFHAQHRAKVEAETRRISEEITRAAQERRRAAQASVPRAPTSEEGAPASEEGAPPAAPVMDMPATYLPPPTRFEHIAVPLDGGAFAERALPYATAVARITGAQLTLAYVDTLPGALDTVNADSHDAQRQAGAIRSHLEALRQANPLEPQRLQVMIQQARSPAQGIRTLEEAGLADLVVMATHARQGIERVLLGSTADGLLRKGWAPLLVVPPRAAIPRDVPILSNALIPLDGSLLSEQALGALGGLLGATPGTAHALREVTLLTVVEHPALIPDGEAYLTVVRQELETQYALRELTIHTVTQVGEPTAIIAGVTPQQDTPAESALRADLLILATHGRGGVGRWLLGSVASSILPKTPLPVLLVHPITLER